MQQLELYQQRLAIDPNQDYQQRLNLLLQQNQAIDAQLNEQMVDMVPADYMPELLGQLLGQIQGIKLLKFTSIAPVPLLAVGEEKKLNLYSHGIRMSLEGDYFSVLRFVEAVEANQASIPNDFLLSLTGSTGGSNNNHEIDNVQICAQKSNSLDVQIDHFEFDHSGQGITCYPETVTLRACANPSCSQLFSDPVTAVLLPDSAAEGIWVGGNQVSFSNGITQLQLRRLTPGVVTLGVKASSPPTKPLSSTLCRIGSGILSSNNCSLTFSDSGFVFDVPDKLANKPVDVVIKAVKKSDSSPQCVPSFQNQTKRLNFWSTYQTPIAPISPQTVTVNDSEIGNSNSAPTADRKSVV